MNSTNNTGYKAYKIESGYKKICFISLSGRNLSVSEFPTCFFNNSQSKGINEW